jgi:acetyl esterase/lipase
MVRYSTIYCARQMKRKELIKKILLLPVIVAALLLLLLVTPRIHSLLAPQRPPVGYFAIPPTYLAVYLGLESETGKKPAVTDDLEVLRDIAYKNWNGKPLMMDLYRAKNAEKLPPLLVFIHGGGWNHGTRDEYLGYALHFARKGYLSATVTYRFASDAPYPACVEDVLDALRFLGRNGTAFRFDTSRVALVGGSAGAHLALLSAYGWHPADTAKTGTAGLRIRGVVDLYGPMNLTSPYARDNYMVTRLMAKVYNDAQPLYREASPINWVDKNSPPTLILHGTSDNLVPIEQAELLKMKLDSLHIPVVWRPLPGWPHTMDLVKRVNRYCTTEMESFFDRFLRHGNL